MKIKKIELCSSRKSNYEGSLKEETLSDNMPGKVKGGLNDRRL